MTARLHRIRPAALIVSITLIAGLAFAQMPQIDEPAATPPAPVKASSSTVDANAGLVVKTVQRFMGTESPYRPVILSVFTLLVLIRLRRMVGKQLGDVLREQAFYRENADSFMRTFNRVWWFVTMVLILIAMSGSLRLLGLTAGFLGMILGWSLQQPVTGLAAWLMIVLKKPFQIGDRVIIAGMTGDVTGISLTHITLNQVGGSVGGEERSGRGILIPNAILFQNIIINYTLDQEYMLAEVPVRLTFDSDWELAKKIMIEVACEATADAIKATGQQPVIRAEFLDWGIMVRLRYQTRPVSRESNATLIVEGLLKRFKDQGPKVRFAIPSQHIRYQAALPDNIAPEFAD